MKAECQLTEECLNDECSKTDSTSECVSFCKLTIAELATGASQMSASLNG